MFIVIIYAYRFAYVEFDTKEGMENALKLDDSVFKGRQLKVIIPYWSLLIITETSM